MAKEKTCWRLLTEAWDSIPIEQKKALNLQARQAAKLECFNGKQACLIGELMGVIKVYEVPYLETESHTAVEFINSEGEVVYVVYLPK